MENVLSLVKLSLISSILTADMLSCNKELVCAAYAYLLIFFSPDVFTLNIVSRSIRYIVVHILSGEGAER